MWFVWMCVASESNKDSTNEMIKIVSLEKILSFCKIPNEKQRSTKIHFAYIQILRFM